ncbi:TolC family protein [Chryseolinea sp. H1M3-3]|uniref:TolC family protein n=1 Tax=Chryseolinea sp. H1M3-3 TaxID=3034144 RepID=UPI0023EDFD87|nr:TolC family protein [Chryseolinea sp. H1M3-3]
MKKLLTFLCLLLVFDKTQGQALEKLTLEESYTLANENYPQINQRDLISKSEAYSISNAAKGIFPVLTINGQESYQSDVTQIPFQSPEMNIDPLSKHQYKVYGEVTMNLYDGGVIKNQKQSYQAGAKIDQQKLEVELYKLNDRVNQLYFGALLLDAQIRQNQLLRNDIERGIQRTEAAIANGIALKSSRDVLQAERLKVNQKLIELNAARTAYLEMLGLMVGKNLEDSAILEKPKQLVSNEVISRPELLLFDYQRQAIDVQNKFLSTRLKPKFSIFFQGGYGRPGLNMLKNEAETYYIGGVRLHWTIASFYTHKKEKALLDISRSNIELQRATFLYNTNLAVRSQKSEVKKIQDVLAADDEIISLREKIKNTASAQLADGVIDSNDYLREVTAEDQARQNKILHEIQLLLAQYSLQTTTGI